MPTKKNNATERAVKITRGGFHTPVQTSEDESDFSTPQSRIRDVVSENSTPSSPMLRGSSNQGGISMLKLQLETLSLDVNRPPRNKSQLQQYAQSTGTPSEYSDDEVSEGTSYEIPLEHDFASADVQKPICGVVEGGLHPRKMHAEDFEPLRCLGKGTYGTVLLVKQQGTGKLYAQKQFRKASLVVHKKLVEQTKTERAILESVNRHPFVVKLFYAFQDHEKLYLILEYAQGGELFHHLAQERMFSEDTASFYMGEMVLALEHLHKNLGVVYRDLKPENCLLDSEGHLLLTDFGLSKVAVDENDHCKSIQGTVEYMAPEVVSGLKYGFAVDWWSFGALGYDLLTGSPPFTGNNHAKILEKIVKQKISMPYFLSPDAKDLLTRLLRKEPTKRLGACMPKDMLTIKKHRFFRKIDWKKLAKREVEPPIQPLITDPEMAENFSNEFTDLALSPVITSNDDPWNALSGGRDGITIGSTAEHGEVVDNNPFGGFSFVASQSLLDNRNGFLIDQTI